jgi:hypothetical protein
MDYRGAAAVIVAIGIAATLIIGVGAVGFAGRTFSEVGGQALIAIGGALAGALAAYLASGRS